MTIKKEDIVGVLLFIIVLVVFGLWYNNNERNKYREKSVLTIGTVIKVEDDYKKVPSIYYVFNIGLNSYTGKSAYPEFKFDIEADLKNRSFPVLYIKDKPEDNQIVISRAQFKRYGLPFPDSLAWTIKLEAP